ncbi:DUF2871 domain-containing protein [Paramicrobacterium chengjingii]|uniref:DUF2871 domain-containing protein n=1 Tax=Paramicrobacterium chengjingii TaxID=2769067 RepID=UPI001421EEA1|nr:DUF2871 domain-containing protein [Microbacterium chengjingii]
MKRLFWAAAASTLLGLAAGLFYREFTKELGVTVDSQLSVVHTHMLALGTLVFLIALVLEKTFSLSQSPLFSWFFWVYSAGLLVSTGGMLANGIITVSGGETSAAVAGIAGMGHMTLTVGFGLLFGALGSRILSQPKNVSEPQIR